MHSFKYRGLNKVLKPCNCHTNHINFHHQKSFFCNKLTKLPLQAYDYVINTQCRLISPVPKFYIHEIAKLSFVSDLVSFTW